jgi:hypothetical protein
MPEPRRLIFPRSSLRIDRHHRSLGHRWTWCRSARTQAILEHIREMTDDSPFVRPTVMSGYPLDPAEKAAVKHALSEVQHARSNGSAPATPEPSGPMNHNQHDDPTAAKP